MSASQRSSGSSAARPGSPALEDLRVVVASDRSAATLEVPAGLSPDLLRLRRMIDDAGICFGLRMDVLRQALSSATSDRVLEIAIGDPGTPGVGKQLALADGLRPGDTIDPQTIIGTWQPAQAGHDGMGVDGTPIVAASGADETLGTGIEEVDGVITSTGDGILFNTAHVWEVRASDAAYTITRLEQITVGVTDDGLEARIRLEAGQFIMAEDLKRCMMAAGICHGLQPDAIRAALHPDADGRTLTVAAGSPATNGDDSSMEQLIDDQVHFATKPDGSLDFREAHSVKEVTTGDLLMKLNPASPGAPGMAIDGQVIPAKDGITTDLSQIAGDGTFVPPAAPDEIRAQRDGIFQKRRNGVIEVLDLLVVDGDLDLETGNIDTHFPVLIKGDIKAGFSVKSLGDVTVGGVIEDARVSAQGDLVVRSGILPGNQRVKAQGDIVAPHIRGRLIKARDVLVSKSLRQCEVFATGRIETSEVLGGSLVAGLSIKAQVVGNNDEPRTVLQAGVDPFKRSLYEAARNDLLALDRDGGALRMRMESAAMRANELGKKTKTRAATGADPSYLKQLVADTRLAVENSRETKAAYDALLAKRETAEAVVNDYLSEEAESVLASASISIGRNIYPGCECWIGRHAHTAIERLHRGCTWVLKDGAVVTL